MSPKMINQKMELNYPVQERPQLAEAISGITRNIRENGHIECVTLECVFNNRGCGCYLVAAQIRHGACLHYNDKTSADELFPYFNERIRLFENRANQDAPGTCSGLPGTEG